MNAVLYIHGKGGSAAEADHYKPLFPESEVIGLDYHGETPWDAGPELGKAIRALGTRYDRLTLIANSIGAYFAMHAGIDELLHRALFISPIVDMEKLIRDMMAWAGVTEAALWEKKRIETAFGETLSWDYLCYVREHPVRWRVPTEILYGSRDALTSADTVQSFAETHHAGLTVMDGGEHWFHTWEQMAFLDRWIAEKQG